MRKYERCNKACEPQNTKTSNLSSSDRPDGATGHPKPADQLHHLEFRAYYSTELSQLVIAQASTSVENNLFDAGIDFALERP